MSSLSKKQQVPVFQIELSLLQHMKKIMQPYQKQFNIIDIFQFIIDYCMKLPNQTFESTIIQQLHQSNQKQNQSQQKVSTQQQPDLTLQRKTSLDINKINTQKISMQIKQRKIKYAQELLDKLKNIFLWYKKKTISYQMINNYILSCQNRTLKYINSLENLQQYQNLPQRRVRLDENVKLCIMPQGDSSKIKSLSINPNQQNRQDASKKQIFVVTSQYIRGIHVDAQKLAKQGNKTVKIHDNQNSSSNRINIVKNWYTYSQQKILPQHIQNKQQDMKINSKKQLYIQKITISQHLVGIITYEKDILIKPFLSQQDKFQRGRRVIPYQIRLGNLITDIPNQNLQKPLNKDKAKLQELEKSKILMFECYNDDIWIVVNQSFIYVYILPLPSSNQYVNDSNSRSAMMSLCQPLPCKAYQAKLITKQYLAIMLEETPCILILKLQLSSKKQLKDKNRIYPTNKIYNDIKFICMNYHPVDKQLLFTDFGSYLIRLKFNAKDGDIQRQGAVYDEKTGKFLTENTTNTKRDKQFHLLEKQSEINIQQSLMMKQFSKQEVDQMLKNDIITKNSSIKLNKQTLTIWQNKGSSMAQLSGSDIHLGHHKQYQIGKKQKNDKSGMSIYTKPQNTDYMSIVKNGSRQNMTLLCINKNTSTIITYQQMSVNPLKNGKQDEQSDKDRLYYKTIKLWDINYMNVYQTFTLSLQIVDLSLQSNGLYIVTKDRGYLGFYPLLNKEQYSISSETKSKKQIFSNQHKQSTSKLNQKIIINGNQIFFYTQLQKQKNYDKIQQQGYQNHLVNYNNSVTSIYNLSFSNSNQNHIITNLQEIPAQITQLEAQNKLYVLSDISGDKKYNTHIYDMLGNKQTMLKGIARTEKYGILQNYLNIKKICHFQFNILMWNKHSIKFIGSNLQQSMIIHWTFSCQQRLQKNLSSQFDLRSLKSSVSKKQKSIEDICVSQNSISIQQKLQNDLFKAITLSIFHLDSGRIKYRIHDIRNNFKVLQMFNNIVLIQQTLYQRSLTSTQGQDIDTQRGSINRKYIKNHISNEKSYPTHPDEQLISVIDFNSPFNKKCVFTLKYKTMIEKNMTSNQIKQYQMNFNNAISHDKFFIQKQINLKSARLFTLNNDDSLIISCIFHLKHQLVFKNPQKSSVHKTKIFHSTQKYIVYTRQISSQIALKSNYIPRTSDANIKKVNKNAMSQYIGQVQIHERIVGHYEIDLDELINRSTIRNFNYLSDIHTDTDEGIQFIVGDITQKIIKFSQEDKHHQNYLSSNQSFIKIYETNSNHQLTQKINVSWILAQAQSPKSIICLSSSKFVELHSQNIAYKVKPQAKATTRNLLVSLQKICHIKIDQRTDKPVVLYWSDSFNSQNKQIWEQTKSQMVEYVKQKLSKQTQKQLKSPSSINIRRSNNVKQTNLITLKQTDAQQKTQQVSKIQTLSNYFEQKSPNIQVHSNEINNMFRQWHINKNIEKEMKQYEKNTNQAQKQLNKQLKHIIQNPTLKQQRIKYLLQFPQKIKDPKLLNALQLISKRFKSLNKNDIFSFINSSSLNNVDTSVKHIQKKIRVTNDQSLQKRIQTRLQKLETSISLPKIISIVQTTKRSFGSEKISELKNSKKLQYKDQRIHSSMTTENYDFTSPQRSNKNTQSLKNSVKIQLTRTKTQASDKNYLQLITETPFQSPMRNLGKGNVIKNFSKYSPNPQSSLSNIKVSYGLKQEIISIQSPNFISEVMNKVSPNTTKVKKDKSILTKAKTETSNQDDQLLTGISKSALVQLKQSNKTMNQSILPQIKINRQKLNEKMKQKKSFLKAINERLCFSKNEVKEQFVRKQKKSNFERFITLQ